MRVARTAVLLAVLLLALWTVATGLRDGTPAQVWAQLRLPRSVTTTVALPRYTVVIDAGSTGSRMLVYRIRDQRPLPDVSLMQVDGQPLVRKVTPGLSSFASRLDELPSSIGPLLDEALTYIPEEHVAQTPLMVLATGGLRLLQDADRDAVLEALCAFISTSYGFRFQCPDARVISGEEEGLYGWIAVNYALGTLDPSLEPERGSGIATVRGRPLGMLDMGGASTQIAFRVDRDTLGADADVFHVDLTFEGEPRHDLFVYSASHLGVGTQAARERYLAQHTSPTSPCFLPGDAPHPSVVGVGDFDACVADLRSRADLLGAVRRPAADVNSVGFLGISEYWYSVWDVFEQRVYSPSTLWPLAREYCSTPHQQVLAAKRAGAFPHADIARLESQCFKLAWIAVVLHDGYGLGADESAADALSDRQGLPALQVAANINGRELSWTLGALLVALARLDDADGLGHHIERGSEALAHMHARASHVDTVALPRLKGPQLLSFATFAVLCIVWLRARAVARKQQSRAEALLPQFRAARQPWSPAPVRSVTTVL